MSLVLVLLTHQTSIIYPCLQDLDAYNKAAVSIAKKYFPLPDVDEYYRKKDARPLIFCHFARGLSDKTYDEVPEYGHMFRILTEALMEYNETNAVMKLVLFEDAMKHVARIARICSSPGGHALLVGVGGSGKQSLARCVAPSLFVLSASTQE